MFSRLGQVVIGLFTSRFESVISATILTVVQDFAKKGKQTLLLIIGSFVLSILFSAGIIISLLEAASQFDKNGGIYFSAMLTSAVSLTSISLVILIALFWPRQLSPIVPVQTATQTPHHSHPLEEIIAAVVAEGMQYFKSKSDDSKAHTKDYSQA